MNIQTALKQLNLDEKESEVYLTSLELGESYVVPISKKVGVPRNTAVYILEGLEKKGLIKIVPKGGRHIYIPESPSTWVKILKKQTKKYFKSN